MLKKRVPAASAVFARSAVGTITVDECLLESLAGQPKHSSPSVYVTPLNFHIHHGNVEPIASTVGALLLMRGKTHAKPPIGALSMLKTSGQSTGVNLVGFNAEPKGIQIPESISAFGKMVLLKQGRKHVLLVTTLQKNLAKEYSKRRGKVIPKDKWESQGVRRHYRFIDAAIQIAKQMRAQGLNVEVHVPHEESVVDLPESTRSGVQRPFALVSKHFHEDRVAFGGAQVKTVNLCKPITKEARELVKARGLL